jgi:mono/diheme cytochrome c family protein
MRNWLLLLAFVVALARGGALALLWPHSGPARNLTLIGDATRGAYLIRLGDCVTCHTDKANGIPALGGGPGLATPFGTFHAPNITPDTQYGIGSWTLAEFSRAMSDGVGPQGNLYPAFPYQHYSLMSDQEIADLFAALKTYPPVAKAAKPHEVGFPFDQRWALTVWKNLYFKPARYTPDATQSAEWNRGRYLAFGPGHCIMCHSPRDILGGILPGREWTGNPAGGTGGKAPPLTAAALAKEGYTDAATLADTIKTGFTPDADVLGSAMGEVIADGTSFWTDEDRLAVATYLLTAKP